MRAGAAKTVITPPLPIQLAGHKGKRIAIGIADDLHARAVVCQDADRKIALVSADLLWLGREQVQRIRNVVEERADIPARNVFIACTHTHSGPDTLDWYSFAEPVDSAWVEVLCRTIASAVYIASKRLQQATVAHFTGSVEIGMGRRRITPTGVERYPNPDGLIDQTLIATRFIGEGDTTIAAVIHQGTHPVVLGADSVEVSADWCGAATRMVEHELGGTALFFNGAMADTNPIGWTNGTYRDVLRLGRRVGAAAIELLCRTAHAPDATADVVSCDVRVPEREHPYLKVAQDRRMSRDHGIITEVQAVRLGSLTYIGLPGECLTATGRAILDGIGGNSAVVSCANDYVGYLPLPSIVTEGGYEAQTSMVDAAGVEKIVETAIQLGRTIGRQSALEGTDF